MVAAKLRFLPAARSSNATAATSATAQQKVFIFRGVFAAVADVALAEAQAKPSFRSPLPGRLLRSLASRGLMLTSTPAHPGADLDLRGAPCSGLADLDAARVLRPGALTLLDGATDTLFAWMADAALMGRAVLVADGGNSMDIYRLSAAARRRAVARFPDATRAELAAHEDAILDRVRLARGFTAHQVQSIVEDILPAAAGQGDDVGLLAAPGLLEMYLDDELSRDESRTLATRALSSLRRLAGRLHVPAVVTNTMLSPRSDHPLRILLEESVDEQVILRAAPHGGTSIHLPRRGAMFLAPGPGRTRLEDFLAPDERAPGVAAPKLVRRTPGAWVSNGNRMYGKFGEARRREPWAIMAKREEGAA